MTAVDEAILLLRVALGLMILAHGYNKIFGAGGLSGTAGWFAALGLQPAGLHARLAAATEIGVGVLLVMGLLTPAATAGLVGLMWVATRTDHRGKGPFVFQGGWEYTAMIMVCAVTVGLVGPGRYSLDRLLGLPGGGLAWGLAGAAVGLIAGGTLLAACYRPNVSAI